MTIYGYARISRPQQSIDRQVRNIKAYSPNAIIIQEAYTGTKMDRPKWNRLYSRIHTGDTIIFDSVSRMSRNAEDGFYMYNELFSKGISLVFLKEPHINTDTYKSALQGGIPATGTNIDCILEGINKYLLSLAKEIILKYSKAFAGTLADADCMKLAGVSRNTFYKYKKELMNE